MTTETPFIIFGYGSLIFKPPPHVIAKVSGYLKGYVRRFAQKSHDHRGTPEAPGRVVTLIHKEDWDLFSDSDVFPDGDIVWGIAYTIDPAYEAEVRDYLDYREKDGYTMETIDIYNTLPDGTEEVLITGAYNKIIDITNDPKCYVGRNDNPSFVGYEPIDALAYRIHQSIGPSGKNKEYLYHLAAAVRELSPSSHDSYLFTLEAKVRALDENDGRDTVGG